MTTITDLRPAAAARRLSLMLSWHLDSGWPQLMQVSSLRSFVSSAGARPEWPVWPANRKLLKIISD